MSANTSKFWSSILEGFSGKTYTLNFDGSHNNQANKSGAGCIIRDNQGEFKLAAAYSLTESYSDYCNVAIAEAMALLNGLKLAKENNLKINIIIGDSTEVIEYVLDRSRRPAKPPLNEIINQISNMIDLNSQTIMVVNREANKVADKLAFWGSSRLPWSREIYTTCTDLPPQVAELIKQEKLRNNMNEVDSGEGSSTSSNLAKFGATLVTGATLAYGAYKLLAENSDDQHRKNTKAPCSYVMNDTHSYSSKSSQIGSSMFIPRESSYGYDHNATEAWSYDTDNTLNHVPNYDQNNDFYTLNFDGSDINQQQKGGAGCIIRNKKGELVLAAAYNLDNFYPNQLNVAIAEAIALRNGLKLAKNRNIKLDLIEGDSKEVIERVFGRERRPPRIPLLNEIIGEIRLALVHQSIDIFTQLKLIERDANKVADELASIGSRLGYGNEKTYTKDDVLTFKLAQLIEKDKLSKGNFK